MLGETGRGWRRRSRRIGAELRSAPAAERRFSPALRAGGGEAAALALSFAQRPPQSGDFARFAGLRRRSRRICAELRSAPAAKRRFSPAKAGGWRRLRRRLNPSHIAKPAPALKRRGISFIPQFVISQDKL